MLVSEVKLVKNLYYNRFKKFSQLIFKVSQPGAITIIYKSNQVCTDDAQKNYVW